MEPVKDSDNGYTTVWVVAIAIVILIVVVISSLFNHRENRKLSVARPIKPWPSAEAVGEKVGSTSAGLSKGFVKGFWKQMFHKPETIDDAK